MRHSDESSSALPAPDEARALHAAALMATLAAALDWTHGYRERKAGRDPAAVQPPAEAFAFLEGAAADLEEVLVHRALAEVRRARLGADGAAAMTAAADAAFSAGRLAALLHGVHQRLLSLYPAAGPDLLEEVRTLHGFALAEGADPGLLTAAGSALLQRLRAFVRAAGPAARG